MNKDCIQTATKLAAVAGGAAAGAAAGRTAARVAGVTAIPVVTHVASWFGLTVLSATPIGWIVGGALLGGGAAYGFITFIKSGAEAEAEKKAHERAREERERKTVCEKRSAALVRGALETLARDAQRAVRAGRLSLQHMQRMLREVNSGSMTLEEARHLLN
jgi:hypothetical protein